MQIEPSAEAPQTLPLFLSSKGLAMLGLLAAIILVLLILVGHVRAEESRTLKNEKGQEIGRSITHGNTTTFSNERGQQTGRAERRGDGSTIFYDAQGRMLGTSKGVPTR
jgi:predicted lipid-binding transport protein (Tim44 family)